MIIVIAFLVVSQTFVSSDDTDPTTPTSPPGPATVYVATELKPVVDAAESTAIAKYGDSSALRQQVDSGAQADAFVGARADAQALASAGRCGEPKPITTGPTELAGCVVIRDGDRSDAAGQFLKDISGIKSRAALLDAGYELPPR